ncbi:MAG: hypothetical protein R3C10_06170 [Pirellulales bacterium]
MLALQAVTGASRPGESTSESHWKPFDDNNGVSGHAFMGAIPFMSAAKMTDNIWFKGALYAASALPAMSRVSDDDHYFSQAFLGWWMAYMAASAPSTVRTILTRTVTSWSTPKATASAWASNTLTDRDSSDRRCASGTTMAVIRGWPRPSPVWVPQAQEALSRRPHS